MSSATTTASMIRDRLVRRTALGRRLLDDIYRQYYRVSPSIAADMRANDGLRDFIRELIVRPLLSHFDLAERYARDGWKDEASFALTARSALTDLRDGIVRAMDLEVSDLERIASWIHGAGSGTAPAGQLTSLTGYITDRLQRIPIDSPLHWAVLEPLAHQWELISRIDVNGSRAIAYVKEWLAAAPLEPYILEANKDPAELENDLARLRDGIFVSPEIRARFASRVSPVDALARAGYL
jgi:hypothetical protein